MIKIRICKCNKTLYGILLGLVLPMLTMLALYKFGYHGDKGFSEFMSTMMQLKSAGMLIAVSSLSNLAVFLIFAQLNKLLIARGLMISTVLYAFATLVFKFLL